jgi:hypothetical protein
MRLMVRELLSQKTKMIFASINDTEETSDFNIALFRIEDVNAIIDYFLIDKGIQSHDEQDELLLVIPHSFQEIRKTRKTKAR